MIKTKNNLGFSLVETLVTTLLTMIIVTAGSMIFIVGEQVFTVTAARAIVVENSRRMLQRISLEVQQSGRDSNNNLMTSVLDGSGVNGTDILRFSIPICVCGTSALGSSGNVNHWGAPLIWGQPGCSTNYPTNAQGKVDICHYPPGNTNNPQDLSVSSNAVKSHLAHGDSIGNCGSCDAVNYTNRAVEYLMNSNGQLIRRVINTNNNNAVINSVVVGDHLTNFQLNLDTSGSHPVLSTTVSLSDSAMKRNITVSNSMSSILRN